MCHKECSNKAAWKINIYGSGTLMTWIIVNFRWLKHPDAWWKKNSPHAWHLQKFPYKVLLWNWLLRIGIPSSTAAAKGKGWHIWHWLNGKRKIHIVLSFQHPTEIWDICNIYFTDAQREYSGFVQKAYGVFVWCVVLQVSNSNIFSPQKKGVIGGFNSQKLFVVGQALISAKASWLRATWASAWHTFEKRRQLRVFGCKTQLERLWGNSSHLCTCIFNDASTSGFSDSPVFWRFRNHQTMAKLAPQRCGKSPKMARMRVATWKAQTLASCYRVLISQVASYLSWLRTAATNWYVCRCAYELHLWMILCSFMWAGTKTLVVSRF